MRHALALLPPTHILSLCLHLTLPTRSQIRRDKNLEALRKSPKFQPLLEKYDEPVINWSAVKATFNFFGKKKEDEI